MGCKHPRFISATCTRCGKSKLCCTTTVTTRFYYLRSNLSLSSNEVKRLRNKDWESLLGRKKLHLLLDLDNTLVHAKHVDNLNSTDKGTEGYIHEDLHNYVLKVRPGTSAFLDELSSFFDMSVYTLGKRSYANSVVKVLDPEKRFFKNVIAREDCTTKGLKGLDVVLSYKRMVLVVDDLKSVWHKHSANLIQIVPYLFFPSKILNVQKLLQAESCTSMDVGLARVLETLKSVHSEFYYGKAGYKNKDDVSYKEKDVRKVLKSVRREELKKKTTVIVGRDQVEKPCSVNDLVEAMQKATLSSDLTR